MNKRYNSTKDFKEKADLLNDQTELIDFTYNVKKERLLKRINTDGKTAQEVLALRARIKEKLSDEFAPLVNDITTNLYNRLNAQGFPVSAMTRKTRSGKKITMLTFDLKKLSEKVSNSTKRIQHYMRRFGTKYITFDILANIRNGSTGFSMAAIKRIELGIRGARNILIDDLLTMVAKHEFKHASFARDLEKNIDSIYHAKFFAEGEQALSKRSKIYSRFMSAEELYNFANNPHWASDRIKVIAKYAQADYLHDLTSIQSYIKMTNSIAKQTEDVTEETLRLIKKIKDDKAGDFYRLYFLKKDMSFAEFPSEASLLSIKDTETGIRSVHYISPRFKKELSQVFRNTHDYKIQLTTQILKAQLNGKIKNVKNFNLMAKRKSFLKSEKEIDILMNYLNHKTKTLSKVSSKLLIDNARIQKQTIELLELIAKKQKAGITDLSTDKEVRDAFSSLVVEYRRVGVSVRERYKNFLNRERMKKLKQGHEL